MGNKGFNKIRELIGKYRYIFLFYFVLSLLVFYRLFVSKGGVLGGDWAFPISKLEIDNAWKDSLYTWNHAGNIFGARQIASVSVVVMFIFKSLSTLGLSAQVIPKLLLVLIFSLASSNFNFFLRKNLKITPLIALLGGAIYITTPIFFNYSLMGWLYVLLFMALLPLFISLFIESVEQDRIRYALLCSLIFSIAALQSQSLVWFPIVMFTIAISYLQKEGKFIIAARMAFFVMISFFILNMYWLPELILIPDRSLASTSIVTSTISLGTSLRLSPVNIIRLWGSLFNYQFEISYIQRILFLSFLMPIIAIIGIYIRRKKSDIIYLLFFLILPFLMYFLDRNWLASIPFSSLIRDVARFAVFSTFAVSVLVSVVLNEIYVSKNKRKWYLLLCLLLLLFFNASPFWSGRLYSGGMEDYDFRFRTIGLRPEYFELESKFQQEGNDKRALFLPTGGMISSSVDLRFNGAFQEMSDVYASFSNVPGGVYFSDRDLGSSSSIISKLNQIIYSNDSNRLSSFLSKTGFDFIVFRRDLKYSSNDLQNDAVNIEKGLSQLVNDGFASVYFDKDKLLVLQLNKKNPLILTNSSLNVVLGSKENSIKEMLPITETSLIPSSSVEPLKNISLFWNMLDSNSTITYESQNKLFSSFQQSTGESVQEKMIGEFVSLEKINNILISKKWKAAQQNLNDNLDQGIKNKNEATINSVELAKLNSDFTKDKYVAYLDDEIQESKIYFKKTDASDSFSNMKINGALQTIIGFDQQNKLYYCETSLKKGLNTIEVISLEPLFLVDLKQNQKKVSAPEIIFSKNNPTKYSIKIDNITDDFVIVFNESYNSYWKILKNSSMFSDGIIPNNQHFVANGFANGWVIKVSDLEKAGIIHTDSEGKKSTEISLFFWPQSLLVLASVVSGLYGCIILTLIIFSSRGKK